MLKLPLNKFKDLINNIENQDNGDYFGLMSLGWSCGHGLNVYVKQLKKEKEYTLTLYLIDMFKVEVIGIPQYEVSKSPLFDVWINKTINLNFLHYNTFITLYRFLPYGKNPYNTYLKNLFDIIQTLPTMYVDNKNLILNTVLSTYPN